ncbi:MAG: tetratricopeptide repeat protein, partial [Vicinamibacterales bacterium]
MTTTATPSPAEPSPAEGATKPADHAKRYWWAGAIAAPIVVALIGLLPSLRGGGDTPAAGDTYINNSHTGGDMFFNTNITLEDAVLRGQMEEAVRLAVAERFVESKALLEQVAAKAPSAAVYNNLGVVRAALGEGDAARSDYERALQLDPADQTANMNLGLLARAEGKLKQASEHFAKAPEYRQAREATEAIRTQFSNNTIRTAASIHIGSPIVSRLAGDGDTDYFTFKTPDGPRDLILVEVENRSTTLTPWLKLYNSQEVEVVAPYATTPGASVRHEFASNPATEYSVQVLPATGDGAVGEYSLSVTARKAFDRFEPNDDITKARPIGTGRDIEASIMDAGDNDFFQFKVNPGPVRAALT